MQEVAPQDLTVPSEQGLDVQDQRVCLHREGYYQVKTVATPFFSSLFDRDLPVDRRCCDEVDVARVEIDEGG